MQSQIRPCRLRDGGVTSPSFVPRTGGVTTIMQRPPPGWVPYGPPPQPPKKSLATRIGCGGFIVIAFCLFGSCAVCSKLRSTANAPVAQSTPSQGGTPAPAVPTAPDDPEKHLLTDEEKGFVGAAGDYLATLNREDKKLAVVMAGAQTGDSTLADIKVAIETARASERDYSTPSVPTPFAAVDKKIRRCKALHDTAFTGMLAGIRDVNTAQIGTGTANMEKAVLVTNECIEDLRVAMKGVADRRRNAAKADAGKAKSP
jgi:hypothetical protein